MQPYNLLEVDGVKIPFSHNWTNIGISLSGGADSALLLYILSNYFTCNIHVITQIRCWKTRPWQEYHSLQVFEWFQTNFPKKNFTRHEGFIPPDLEWGRIGPTITDEYGKLKSGNQIILRSHNEYICHKEKINAWFAAVNRNPNIKLDGALKDRDDGHILPIFNHMNTVICHPFIKTRKDWIIQQYYNFDILDLLDLTRSCEGDKIDYPEIFGDLDFTTYIPGQYVPECGKCFWCNEREWALNRVK